jgi:hypothetical protein
MMKKGKLIMIVKMTLAIFFIISILSAVAIPKYLNLNKQNEANQCRANQIVVETALACVYAESLAVCCNQFPNELTPGMFEDGKIPTCPVDGKPIAFDHLTGHAFCPNHIEAHSRSF